MRRGRAHQGRRSAAGRSGGGTHRESQHRRRLCSSADPGASGRDGSRRRPLAASGKAPEGQGRVTGLRPLLAGPEIVVAPGIYDGFSAMLVAEAGFKAAYLSGASICYTRFGYPDIGLVSMTEVADTLGAIRERAILPVVVDIDTGFGNALNVQRTVQLFESRGASALQLEDQVTPKRCGHLADKALISSNEMVGKIKAALDARRSLEMMLIARTDAIAVEGFDKALARAHAY